jgi:tetratricopeptide (TPR) repeat protein
MIWLSLPTDGVAAVGGQNGALIHCPIAESEPDVYSMRGSSMTTRTAMVRVRVRTAMVNRTMKGMTRMLHLFCLVASLFLADQAWADGCSLSKWGTLRVEMIGPRATTLARINGKTTRLILDTGAFYNFMSGASVALLGINPLPAPKGYKMAGIGGNVNVQQAFVRRFDLPGMPNHNHGAIFIVGGSDAGNALLGANLLDEVDLDIDLAHGNVTLFQSIQCDNTPLAYWTKEYNVVDILPSKNSLDRRTFLIVTINGARLRALLDSGAPSSVMSRYAAERAGINVITPGSKTVLGTGVGAKSLKEWTVNVDTFAIGQETIQHTEMQVIDGSIADGVDMLLGADFLLAHHVYVANDQEKVYFTYNGGRVFTNASVASDSDTSDSGTAAANDGNPKSAADYFLSGQAHLSRDELNAALADLDKAILLSPHRSAYFLARARAYEADKRPDAALADLDSALSVDPKNGDALLMRAELRLNRNDRAGASADMAAMSNMLPPGSMRAQAAAVLYIKLGQPMAALPLLDGWIVMHDNDAMLGRVLSERCLARGLSNQMLDDALTDCRNAIRRDGKKPDYLGNLGLVEWRLGHYSDSIKAYRQAADKAPDSAWLRYGLAVAEIRDGRQDAGNADLNAARALDPQIDERAAKYGLTASTQ